MAKPVVIRILGDAKSLQKALGQADGALGKLGKTGALAGKAVAGGVTAAAIAIGKGFVDAMGAQDLERKLENSLGVSPERAAELGDIAGSLYRDAWGSSLEDVSNSVIAVESTLGEALGAGGLEAATEQALGLASAFDMDVNEAITAAGQLVKSGLAKDSTEAFDIITRGFQETPIGSRDELLAASTEYSGFFNQLGLDGEEAMTLLSRAGEQGAIGVDKAGDAIKEFTIRSTDMSTTSQAAYEAIGLDANKMANDLLAGGDTANEAFDSIINGLLDIEDPAAQSQAAIALFGTPLEDLGTGEIPNFLGGLTDLTGGLGDLDGAAQGVADSMDGTVSAKIEAFRRQALGKLADFATKYLIPAFEKFHAWSVRNWPAIRKAIEDAITPIVAWVRNNWPQISATATRVFNTIRSVVKTVVKFVKDNWPQIEATVSEVLATVEAAISGFIAIVTDIWERWGTEITAVVTTIFNAIKGVIDGALQVIGGVFQAFRGVFSGDWRTFWNGLKSIFGGIWKAIVAALRGILNTLKTVAVTAFKGMGSAIGGAAADVGTAIKDKIKEKLDDTIQFFREMPGRIRKLIPRLVSAGEDLAGDLAGSIKDGLLNAFTAVGGLATDIGEAVFNAIKSFVNTQVIDKFNRAVEFDIPMPLGLPAFKINPPDIPHLRHGGPFRGAAIVGEDGPEILRGTSMGMGGSVMSSREANSSIGPRGNVTVNVYGSDATPEQIAAAVAWKIRRLG